MPVRGTLFILETMLIELRYLSTQPSIDWNAIRRAGERLEAEVARHFDFEPPNDALTIALMDAQVCASKILDWAAGFEADAQGAQLEYIDRALHSVRSYSQ
jgi:hypothetical protein